MGQLIYGTFWGNYGDEKATSTSEVLGIPLGTRMVLPVSRVFRYSFANGAIGAGQTCQPSTGVGDHDMDLVTTAASVGDKSITLTLAGTAATKDQYKDGYVYVNDGAGEGHVYKVRGHAAISSGGTGAINLYDGDAVAEAITAASLTGLMVNEYTDVAPFDAGTVINPCIGVATTEVADNAYFWLQTWGPCAVLVDVISVLGEPVKVSDNADGATEALNRDATDEDDQVIGAAMLIPAISTDYGMILLQISP